MKLISVAYKNTVIGTEGTFISKKTVATLHGTYKQITEEQFNTLINLIELDKTLAVQYIIQLEKELRYAKV